MVECDWLFVSHVVDEGRDLSASVELFDLVNRQDFEACERCQPGMSSRAYANGGVLVPSEHHIGAFHDWVQEIIPNIVFPATAGPVRKPNRSTVAVAS